MNIAVRAIGFILIGNREQKMAIPNKEARIMGKVNWRRVILGGLLAGVIIDISEWVTNGVVFASDWANVMKNLHSSSDFSVKQIAALNVWGFLTGIAVVCLYAAMRPRFGAGPKTAVLAGAAVWFMAYALGSMCPGDHALVSARSCRRHDADRSGRGRGRGAGWCLGLQGSWPAGGRAV